MSNSDSPQSHPPNDETSGALNPYQPTDLLSENKPVSGVSLPHTQSIPDSDFWFASGIGTFFLLISAFLTQGFVAPIFLAYLFGIVRVCLVFSRRARLGLEPLAAGELLFTSTLLCFALLIASSVAFLAICTAGVVVAGGRESVLEMVMALSGLITFIGYVVLVLLSVRIALR